MNIKIDCGLSEYIEKLQYEKNTAERELRIAKALGFKKETVCATCKRAKVAQVKYATACEEFGKMLAQAIPKLKSWNLDFRAREVTYETS